VGPRLEPVVAGYDSAVAVMPTPGWRRRFITTGSHC